MKMWRRGGVAVGRVEEMRVGKGTSSGWARGVVWVWVGEQGQGKGLTRTVKRGGATAG